MINGLMCALDDLTPNTGAGALVGGQAVAIFRVGHENVFTC